jgi:hypothetical protein
MRKPKWSDLEKQLDYLDKPELIELLRDLFSSTDAARAFLANRFLPQGDGGQLLEKYRKRVIRPFYPGRGFGKLDLGEARGAIREYRKNTGDLTGTIDLLLTYVENGTRFTNEYGDIDERFYNSLESALSEMAGLLKTNDGAKVYPQFQKRVDQLKKAAGGIGWGYGDAVGDILAELEAFIGVASESGLEQDRL